MQERELKTLVQQMGVQRALHVADCLEQWMPTLLRSRAGQKTCAFINALRAAATRLESEPKDCN